MNIFVASYLAVSVTFATGSTSHSSLRTGGKRQMQPAVFPLYNQQCRDDAGPPYMDDAGTFGNKKYHEGKPAFAVGDDCPDPLKGACSQKPKTEAFLEGPIDCGGRGWFCRIVEEPGWPTITLTTDVNFGYCNTTEGIEDAGFDKAGHCHGSDSDDTFYWWVRDHWHRQYNGRLRCCCGWNDLVTEGTIVNRCDYRRLVTREENLEDCRDANEEGVTPYNGGCDQNNAPTLNQPIPEDDSQCWEVQRFGEPDGTNSNDENENENENENEVIDENENNSGDDNDETNSNDENEVVEENENDSNEGNGDQSGDNNDETNSNDENEVVEENENDSNDGNGDQSGDNNDETNSNDENEVVEENENDSNDGNGDQSGDNNDETNSNDENENENEVVEENENNSNDGNSDQSGDNNDETNSNDENENEVVEENENDSNDGNGDQSGDDEETNSNDENENEVVQENEENDNEDGNEDGNGSVDEEEEEENDSNECMDDPSFRFRGRPNKDCDWVAGRANKFCPMRSGGKPVSKSCPVACDECDQNIADDNEEEEEETNSGDGENDEVNEDQNEENDEDGTDGGNGVEEEEEEEENDDPNCADDPSFLFRGKPNKGCDWVAARAEKFCPKRSGGKKVSKSCPVACEEC